MSDEMICNPLCKNVCTTKAIHNQFLDKTRNTKGNENSSYTQTIFNTPTTNEH